MHRAKPLTDPDDAREDLASEHDGCGGRFELVEAVVARPAAVLSVAIAKVLGKMLMTASHARRVAFHLPQQRGVGVVQLAVAFEHHAPLHEVGGGIDQQAFSLEAIASRASGLLLIVLDRAWRAGMHDEANIR